MNINKLKEAEALFLQRYPGGFEDPAMHSIKKRHPVDKLITFARDTLVRKNCDQPELVVDAVLTIVASSSMVSRFEKPPFRDFIGSLTGDDKRAFATAVEQRLHGRKQRGFEEMLDILSRHKLAKWSLISAVPFYYQPDREVFVKPTTAKGIVAHFEVQHLQYDPTPTWEFYRGYRDLVTNIRQRVSPSLSPNNAALTGFLMMSMK